MFPTFTEIPLAPATPSDAWWVRSNGNPTFREGLRCSVSAPRCPPPLCRSPPSSKSGRARRACSVPPLSGLFSRLGDGSAPRAHTHVRGGLSRAKE